MSRDPVMDLKESPAVDMLIPAFLPTFLVMAAAAAGGAAPAVAAAAASNRQLYGESVQDVRTSSRVDGRHNVTKQQLHQQMKSSGRRSLDLKSLSIEVTPTASRSSLPTIVRLYPPTDKPLHMHANIPLRFGRRRLAGEDQTPNLPQRFGRSWKVLQLCTECLRLRRLPEQQHRLVRDWSLVRTLADDQLAGTGLHWAGDFDYASSSEVMQRRRLTDEDHH